MTHLRGRHVLVTGGSEGIGLATARLAAEHGARVSLVARRADVLAEAASSISPSTRWAAADVTDPDALGAAIAELREGHGPVDVLVSSAGYARPARFLDLTLDEFRRQVEVNYLGTVHAVAAVASEMVERRRGHVVLVSSTAGIIGVYGYTAYSPTKFAVRGLGEALRSELRPHGVRVSIVYPPDTDTPGFAEENRTKPPETAAISGSVAPRSADEVARAIVRGIEHDRFTIVADPTTGLLARTAGLVSPLVHRYADRVVRRVRERGHAPPRGGGAAGTAPPEDDRGRPDAPRWWRP